jgi:hypothetical protein
MQRLKMPTEAILVIHAQSLEYGRY